MKLIPFLGAILIAANLAACQSTQPPDSRAHIAQWLPSTLELAMADPVRVPEGEITLNDPFDAQQATLLYSPESSRLLAQLAMHDANYWQATLLKNPGLGVELMRPERGGRWSLGFKLELSLLDWLSRQHRLRFAEAERLSWQAETLTALNQLLRTTSQQWLTAVAARHKTQVQRELLETTQVAAELAKLLHDAGNISELAMLGYASVAAQQAQHLMHAELAEKQTLSRLRVVSGLPYATQISIPANLPAPPETTGQWLAALDAVELIVLADQHQPALELARRSIIHDEQQLLLAERRLGLRQAGLSLETERKSSAERYHGFGIDISPPLFDSGAAEISGLDARLQQSKASMEWQNLTYGSDIEQSLDALRTSFQRLEQLTESDLPRYEQMLRLSLLEYNFMLGSSFDLLAIKQQALQSRLDHVDTLFQFWFALSELERLTGQNIYPGGNTHD